MMLVILSTLHLQGHLLWQQQCSEAYSGRPPASMETPAAERRLVSWLGQAVCMPAQQEKRISMHASSWYSYLTVWLLQCAYAVYPLSIYCLFIYVFICVFILAMHLFIYLSIHLSMHLSISLYELHILWVYSSICLHISTVCTC